MKPATAVLFYRGPDGRRTWHPLGEVQLPDDVFDAVTAARPGILSFYLVDDGIAADLGLVARIVIAQVPS